jgi:diguanylate cyclase (GGDEF)-like protein
MVTARHRRRERLDDATARRTPTRLRWWLVVTAASVIIGVAMSFVAAEALTRRQVDAERRRFETQSAEIAATTRLAIKGAEDLTIAVAAFVLEHPNVTRSEFSAWVRQLRAYERYPELKGIGFMVPVTPEQLPGYAAAAVADATDRPPAAREFALLPPGERPFYCLMRVSESTLPALPLGLDLCETGTRDRLLESRDTGETFFEATLLSGTWLGIQTPVYAGGSVPTTPGARRAAFLGWLGTVIDPAVVLEQALSAHPGVAARIRYQSPQSTVGFLSGSVPRDALSVRTGLESRWTLVTYRAPLDASILGTTMARVLLFGGIFLSILGCALFAVLVTGRARAERLVAQKTEELREQALHDPLTGLANRALLADRIDHVLARCRRGGVSAVAFYLDLDDFKAVNDTFGHEVGDQLLQEVASRLLATVREADTIGRMGGDEFVVLVDGSVSSAGPDLVADRLLDALRRPYHLPGIDEPLSVSASIGIAEGAAVSASELLRDADKALYRSKAAGKDRSTRLPGPDSN